MNQLGIAVVGPGRISRAHLVAIRNNPDVARLTAIVGLPNEADRTSALAAEFGAARAYDDLERALADPEIDAVVLTVPNHLHRDMSIQCMQAGKHVLVEKPLANTAAEADDMIDTARRTQRVLMTAQCRRFFPGALEAKRRVAALGRPLDITHVLGVNVDAPKTDWWRSSSKTGGLALGLNGPHVIDTILWYMEEMPVRVYAQTSRLKPEQWEGEDQATVVLTFADGSTASGHVSLNMKPDTNERWIAGPKGCLHLRNDRTLLQDGEEVVGGNLTAYIDGDESFDAQLREFALAVREQREPLASAAQTRGVVQVLAAALTSAASNQPVSLQPGDIP